MATEKPYCCAEGYPDAWHEREFEWHDRLFVKGHVRSLFHLPLNFVGVLTRNVRLIEAAGALPEEFLVMCDYTSLWGADMYIAVTKDVPGAEMARLSGTFVTKVYEGPFKQISTWIDEMRRHVAAQGRQPKNVFVLYKTCPRCAKKYGKNYVVLLAQV